MTNPTRTGHTSTTVPSSRRPQRGRELSAWAALGGSEASGAPDLRRSGLGALSASALVPGVPRPRSCLRSTRTAPPPRPQPNGGIVACRGPSRSQGMSHRSANAPSFTADRGRLFHNGRGTLPDPSVLGMTSRVKGLEPLTQKCHRFLSDNNCFSRTHNHALTFTEEAITFCASFSVHSGARISRRDRTVWALPNAGAAGDASLVDRHRHDHHLVATEFPSSPRCRSPASTREVIHALPSARRRPGLTSGKACWSAE